MRLYRRTHGREMPTDASGGVFGWSDHAARAGHQPRRPPAQRRDRDVLVDQVAGIGDARFALRDVRLATIALRRRRPARRGRIARHSRAHAGSYGTPKARDQPRAPRDDDRPDGAARSRVAARARAGAAAAPQFARHGETQVGIIVRGAVADSDASCRRPARARAAARSRGIRRCAMRSTDAAIRRSTPPPSACVIRITASPPRRRAARQRARSRRRRASASGSASACAVDQCRHSRDAAAPAELRCAPADAAPPRRTSAADMRDEHPRCGHVAPAEMAGAQAKVVLLAIALGEQIGAEQPDRVQAGAANIQAEADAHRDVDRARRRSPVAPGHRGAPSRRGPARRCRRLGRDSSGSSRHSTAA